MAKPKHRLNDRSARRAQEQWRRQEDRREHRLYEQQSGERQWLRQQRQWQNEKVMQQVIDIVWKFSHRKPEEPKIRSWTYWG